MSEQRGLYRSSDRWIRNLSRGRCALLIGLTGAASTYALHPLPLLSYSRPSIIELLLVAVATGAFGYLIRPFQNDPR